MNTTPSSISVMLPTVRRPAMLRSALHSIANQTALSAVSEIIVSENSQDTASQAVCAEFTHLPIRWLRQKQPFSAYDHFRVIAAEASSPLLAYHGDDDLWSRYHLEEALRCLTAYPEAMAYAPCFVYVANETSRAIQRTQQSVAGIRAGSQCPLQTEWLITAEQMFLETLVQVPFNFWSVVGHRAAMTTAMQRWDHDSGWDVDRLFYWQLAQAGPLVHGRETGMCHRLHLGATHVHIVEHREAWARVSGAHTRKIIHEAEALGMQPQKIWRQLWDELDTAQRAALVANMLEGVHEALSAEWGPACCAVPAPSRRKALLRNLCPPVIWNFLRGLRRQPATRSTDRPALNQP